MNVFHKSEWFFREREKYIGLFGSLKYYTLVAPKHIIGLWSLWTAILEDTGQDLSCYVIFNYLK